MEPDSEALSSNAAPQRAPPARYDRADPNTRSFTSVLGPPVPNATAAAAPQTTLPTKRSEPFETEPNWQSISQLLQIPISELHAGQIFRAVLKHPHHQTDALYILYYLVVGLITVSQQCVDRFNEPKFCAVGLETNGGQSRYCYTGEYLRYIKTSSLIRSMVNATATRSTSNEDAGGHLDRIQSLI